jgi:hypothetical protein
MNLSDFVMPLIVAVCAAVYAIFVGRAQALRLRGLQVDISKGSLKGYFVVLAVIAMVLVSFLVS